MCADIVGINRDTKVKRGIGTFINRRSRTGKKFYDRFFIYVPTEVARDGTFPFKENDKIEVEIDGNTLIIRKASA
jgi:hypothetical protein